MKTVLLSVTGTRQDQVLTPAALKVVTTSSRTVPVSMTNESFWTTRVSAAVTTATAPRTALMDEDQDALLDQDIRSYVSALWAEDWDSAEDQLYDVL